MPAAVTALTSWYPDDQELAHVGKILEFKRARRLTHRGSADPFKFEHEVAQIARAEPSLQAKFASNDNRGLTDEQLPGAYAYGSVIEGGNSIADVIGKGPTPIHTHPIYPTMQAMGNKGWVVMFYLALNDGLKPMVAPYGPDHVFFNIPGGKQFHGFIPEGGPDGVVNFAAVTPGSLGGEHTIDANEAVHPKIYHMYHQIAQECWVGKHGPAGAR